EFTKLVDEDTAAFNKIMDAFSLPNVSDADKAKRSQAIQDATKYAIEVPYRVMKLTEKTIPVLREMVLNGMQSSLSDCGVGALCMKTAVSGAFLNVKINAGTLKDKDYAAQVVKEAGDLEKKILIQLEEIIAEVNKRLG